MQSAHLPIIHLFDAAQEAKVREFRLEDAFFETLEQEEITGGSVKVAVQTRAALGGIYTLSITMEGSVSVQCDRCLDRLTLPVSASEEIKVKQGEAEESDAEDMLYATDKAGTFDLSWELYEIIETSLPIQRVHPAGECNPDMLAYIKDETQAESEADA